MSRYKVTLKPLDWFFFGGDQTFDNGDTQSFIARSNRFPQQTTLLGMVRYQLLKQEKLLLSGDKEADAAKKPDIDALIGKESFDIESAGVQSFGKIKSISPVFIQYGERRLIPMPLSYGLNIGFCDEDAWMSGKRQSKVINAAFEEKKYSNYCKLIDDKMKSWDYEGDEGIFSSSMQIGITKADDGDENDKGFFKQETLRFKSSDTSFAFYLELDDNTILKDDVVFIGAQRSCFKMEVRTSEEKPFIPDHPAGSILLLSPTYVANRQSLDENCLQHWSGTLSFCNIRQSDSGKLRSGVVCYHRHRSLCTFLTTGTVIFFDNNQIEELEKLLNKQNLYNIGYNHFSVKK